MVKSDWGNQEDWPQVLVHDISGTFEVLRRGASFARMDELTMVALANRFGGKEEPLSWAPRAAALDDEESAAGAGEPPVPRGTPLSASFFLSGCLAFLFQGF